MTLDFPDAHIEKPHSEADNDLTARLRSYLFLTKQRLHTLVPRRSTPVEQAARLH